MRAARPPEPLEFGLGPVAGRRAYGRLQWPVVIFEELIATTGVAPKPSAGRRTDRLSIRPTPDSSE
jgi:hypothetical protein